MLYLFTSRINLFIYRPGSFFTKNVGVYVHHEISARRVFHYKANVILSIGGARE